MRVVAAADLVEELGWILDELDSTGEPIVIREGGTARAALISRDDFERHFHDYQVQERRRDQLERVRRMRAPSGPVDTVELLRRLRGYAPSVAGP